MIVVLPGHFLHVDQSKTRELDPEVHQSKITTDIHVWHNKETKLEHNDPRRSQIQSLCYPNASFKPGTSSDDLGLFFTKQRFSFISLFFQTTCYRI